MKTKLKEKTDEVQNLKKSNTMLRESVTRFEKEKLNLQQRLKKYVKMEVYTLTFKKYPILSFFLNECLFFSLTKPSTVSETKHASYNNEEMIAGLKERIFYLEDEVRF